MRIPAWIDSPSPSPSQSTRSSLFRAITAGPRRSQKGKGKFWKQPQKHTNQTLLLQVSALDLIIYPLPSLVGLLRCRNQWRFRINCNKTKEVSRLFLSIPQPNFCADTSAFSHIYTGGDSPWKWDGIIPEPTQKFTKRVEFSDTSLSNFDLNI